MLDMLYNKSINKQPQQQQPDKNGSESTYSTYTEPTSTTENQTVIQYKKKKVNF